MLREHSLETKEPDRLIKTLYFPPFPQIKDWEIGIITDESGAQEKFYRTGLKEPFFCVKRAFLFSLGLGIGPLFIINDVLNESETDFSHSDTSL